MIEIKLTAENAPALFAELRELLKQEPLKVIDGGKPDDEPAAEPVKKVRKKRVSKKAPGKASVDVAEAPVQHLDGTPVPTIDEVRSSLHALATATNHDAVKGLLGTYGASKISELKESDYAAVVKAALEAHS